MGRGILLLAAVVFPIVVLAQQSGGLPALQSDLAVEKTRAAAAESSLAAQIASEATQRVSADTILGGAISTEAAERQSGDAGTLASAKAYVDRKGITVSAEPAGPNCPILQPFPNLFCKLSSNYDNFLTDLGNNSLQQLSHYPSFFANKLNIYQKFGFPNFWHGSCIVL